MRAMENIETARMAVLYFALKTTQRALKGYREDKLTKSVTAKALQPPEGGENPYRCSVYALAKALSELEETGAIRFSESSPGLRTVFVTDKGREYWRAHSDDFKRRVETFDSDAQDQRVAYWGALQVLATADKPLLPGEIKKALLQGYQSFYSPPPRQYVPAIDWADDIILRLRNSDKVDVSGEGRSRRLRINAEGRQALQQAIETTPNVRMLVERYGYTESQTALAPWQRSLGAHGITNYTSIVMGQDTGDRSRS
jgi:hypothetical protein